MILLLFKQLNFGLRNLSLLQDVADFEVAPDFLGAEECHFFCEVLVGVGERLFRVLPLNDVAYGIGVEFVGTDAEGLLEHGHVSQRVGNAVLSCERLLILLDSPPLNIHLLLEPVPLLPLLDQLIREYLLGLFVEAFALEQYLVEAEIMLLALLLVGLEAALLFGQDGVEA